MNDNDEHALWDALRLPIDAVITEIPDSLWTALVTHATDPSSTLVSLELLPPDDPDDGMSLDLDLEPDLDIEGIVELGDDDFSDDVDLAYPTTGDAESAAHSTMAGASDVAEVDLIEDDPTAETFTAPEIEQHHDGARGDQW